MFKSQITHCEKISLFFNKLATVKKLKILKIALLTFHSIFGLMVSMPKLKSVISSEVVADLSSQNLSSL
jgi:hypothetical protein